MNVEPIFEARCNCLYANDNVSTESLERLSRQIRGFGLAFSVDTIASNVDRFGNWVGGRVSVFEAQIVFSMNKMNAHFQLEDSDLVVPTAMIGNVSLGKMLLVAKTVDCEFMGATLRFRCNGKNNDRLKEAIESVIV